LKIGGTFVIYNKKKKKGLPYFKHDGERIFVFLFEREK